MTIESVSRGTHYLRIPDAHINWLGLQLDEFLSAKGEALDNITVPYTIRSLISILDTQGMAPNTLSVNLANRCGQMVFQQCERTGC